MGTGIPADAVIMTKDKVTQLHDGLFELRCAAEDVATASAEGANANDLKELCAELVALARDLEKIR
ncbi:hypothetical protein [Corynebacterium incognita]